MATATEDADDFPATLDSLALAITVIATLLILAPLVYLWVIVHAPTTMTGLVGALAIGGLSLADALRPRGYSVDDAELRVRRLLTPRRFALREVSEIKRITPGDLGAQIRLFGSGGLGGYFGLFRSSTIGNFRAYATRRDTMVLVRLTVGSPIVLSPDDPERLIAAIRARASASRQ